MIVRQAKHLAADGWLAKGYEYIIIDDCWPSKYRDPSTKKLIPDPKRFPHGLKWLSDFVHSLGLKFGIYLDFGSKTCAGYPGSMDFLKVDADTMAEWSVDFIKMDGCNSDLKIQADGYAEFGRYLNATKRPIVYGCSYPLFQRWTKGEYLNWTQLAENCNLWRLLDDIQDSWVSLQTIMRKYEIHRETVIPVAGPGHWNDLDMLLGGNFGLSLDETRVQFGMWAMHATPLILSVDLANIPANVKEVLLADFVIRVSQDKMGSPADMLESIEGIQVWKRRLVDFNGGWALAFLHLSDSTGYPKMIVLTLREVGIPEGVDQGEDKQDRSFKLLDAFSGTDLITVTPTESFEVRVNPSGIVMLIVQPTQTS
ncbi:unnamed protein product [Mesocestoides corti]|uniref:Alpha-galactosidase n=1 Tax=Mesocestoides corti TaxID=53468 RepID=A0A3P6I9Z7_MESCO|nr:unnamed protein product [Mesocestoides corti]